MSGSPEPGLEPLAAGLGMDLELEPELELEVGAIAGGGGCVARDDDGRVVFVRHALPGERVRARVTSSTTTFRRADAVEILVASPDRVPTPCPFAGPGACGGCDFQHVSLPAQRALKADRVHEQLQHLAGVTRQVEVEAVEGDKAGLGWRTRVRLAVDEQGRAGFRRHRSHDVLPVDRCPIAHPAVMATGALGLPWVGAEEVEVVVGTPGGTGAMVVVRGTPREAGTPLEVPEVDAGLTVNHKVVRRPAVVHATVSGTDFRVSSGVFWQVHAGAAQALADTVLAELDPGPGDNVVDLYAGAGLFAVLLAQRVGPKGSVLAVERDRRACADLRHNSRDLPQVRVMQASISPGRTAKGLGQPDLLVLDPAREGAGTAVMRALASDHGGLRRLAYVACDAGSFSRDVRVLLDAGWELASLRAFDIFPMTEHVELVAGLVPPSAQA